MLPVCPKCDSQLFILNFQGVELDLCPKCKGVWLDSGELEAIVIRTKARPDDTLLTALSAPGNASKNRKYMCPRCDHAMNQLELTPTDGEPLVIERCWYGHGLWFDEDELQKVLALFDPTCGARSTIAFLNDFFGRTPRDAHPPSTSSRPET